jgi:hypothetical protein
MSFEDIQEVDVDMEEGTFVIIRNDGTVSRAYGIDEERELFSRILQYSNEVEIYVVT